MKTSLFFLTLLSSIWILPEVSTNHKGMESDILGAWRLATTNGEKGEFAGTMLIEDGYVFYTEYDIASKHFEGSIGGQCTVNGDSFDYTIEFDTWKPERIGQGVKTKLTIDGAKMTLIQSLGDEEATMTFFRVDDGKGDLAGAWRITDRLRNGEMQAMRQGARKTIKMITGTRFQWAAFNPETKRFSGTGGGTVTLKDGEYTEHIEFFSKNQDRVGASLSFDYKVNGIKWDHSGMSSSGNPIREIWTRQNQ